MHNSRTDGPSIDDAERLFWDALANDLDTPAALAVASALAGRLSGLASAATAANDALPPLVVARAARTMTRALTTLGLNYAGMVDATSLTSNLYTHAPSARSSKNHDGRITTEPGAAPSPAAAPQPGSGVATDAVVDALVDFRARVAAAARVNRGQDAVRASTASAGSEAETKGGGGGAAEAR